MQVSPRVWLVGGGGLGVQLTDPHDSHIFLVDGGSDAVLIDAGCGLASDAVAAHVRGVLGAKPVSRILLTHSHPDHAAGASSLARALGASIAALPPTASWVGAGDADRCGLTDAIAAGIYPPAVHLEPTNVESVVDFELVVGEVELTVIPTPGHAEGHACFSFVDGTRRVLFTGDLVFSGGRVAVLETPDTDVRAMADSIRLVRAGDPDLLLAGHGDLVTSEARAHLDAALFHFDRDLMPPPLVPVTPRI